MEKTPLSWSKLGAHFADEDKAREYMEFLRWGNAGPACPRCGGSDPYRLTPKAESARPGRKGLLKCRACRKQFTVTVGTVFEDSHIKLTKWIQAIYLIGASKKGISAHQLHRMFGVTYRSAWFMAHRLRYAMGNGRWLRAVGHGRSRRGLHRRQAQGRPWPSSCRWWPQGCCGRPGRARRQRACDADGADRRCVDGARDSEPRRAGIAPDD